ncbi:NadS family protein [Aeromonas veronii]|uniref:Transcriptional regulator n=1 Tax=Aeromonas veronii TaxID=654 RepID=A0A2T4MZC8_AERVE|nr:NadS family protein [Aeromonas veronii]PTH79911.1 transcriptional regulator [Aeromonas veronii]
MNMFDELTKSLVEAIAISNSEAAPSRITKIRIPDVKKIRAANGLTQEALADFLSSSVDTIKSWESGRRNPTSLTSKVLLLIEDNPSFLGLLAKY